MSTKRPGSRRLTQSITRRTTRRASCCRSSTDGAAGDGCPVGVPGDPDPVARGSGRHNKGSPYSGGRRLFRMVTAAIDYTSRMPTVSCTDSPSSVLTITLVLPVPGAPQISSRSEEHTSELQSLMRISYAVFCLKKKNKKIYSTHVMQKFINHKTAY